MTPQEKKREHDRKYRAANREKNKEKSRLFRFNNPEYNREYSKRWKAARPNYDKDRHLRNLYGITLAERDELIAMQNSLCAICKEFLSEPHVDHAHTTKKVRGILCRHCNFLIGLAKENCTTLQNAVKYLKKHLS